MQIDKYYVQHCFFLMKQERHTVKKEMANSKYIYGNAFTIYTIFPILRQLEPLNMTIRKICSKGKFAKDKKYFPSITVRPPKQ